MSNYLSKPYNLEQRTLEFVKGIIMLCRSIQKDTINNKLISQLIRSSGSVGANYREASAALSKKDFLHRMKITRKECKETSYWLELLKQANDYLKHEIDNYITESKELRNIFTAIIEKSK